jgi:glycerol-3-phosphate dehydrogenase
MVRDLARLTSSFFDVLVVGGGIHGVASAYDAAQRGLSVALIEREDFGSASSSNHLKTVHGGLRYLQSGDFPRMRESIRERRAIARIAPHLVSPLPFVIATRGLTTRSRLAMGIAFRIDALLAHDRNDGVPLRLHLPAGRVITRADYQREVGGDLPKRVTGGALWYDYQMLNTDRLTLAFALAAAQHGAHLANHVEAVESIREGGRVIGARGRDRLTGQTLEIRASVTLNTAGAAVGRLMAGFGVPRAFPLLKAMNVVTSRPAGSVALGAPTSQGRLLFSVPWQGRLMVGTSHSDRLFEPDQTDVTEAELDAFLAEINDAFPALRLSRDEVTLVHRGLVPATQGSDGRMELRGHGEVRDHAQDGIQGAVSVVAVKYTTARGVAEQAVDLVCRKLNRPTQACRTDRTPLPGAVEDPDATFRLALQAKPESVDEDTTRHLVETYGSAYADVLSLASTNPQWRRRVTPSRPVIVAELVRAARTEMACTLTDAVVRRTPLGSAGCPDDQAIQVSAAALRAELGWGEARLQEEIKGLVEFYRPVGRRLP